jgi:hypothetical protein
VLRTIGLILSLSQPALAQEPGWAGGYGGLSFGTAEPEVEVFVGAMTERGPAVVGIELGAAAEDGALALTGRVGRSVGETLLYGLAGLGSGEGEGVLLGAGASRRLGGVRIGGELRHDLGEGQEDGETRLGGRIALEF